MLCINATLRWSRYRQHSFPFCHLLILCSYHRVKLRSVHHTAKSNCTPQSQNQNLWESLVAFKVTIKRIPFRGKLFYYVRKDLKILCWIAKTIILTPRCDAHSGVEFFVLCDRISWGNWNRIRKYFSLFIRGPDGFESWKKWSSKILWHSL